MSTFISLAKTAMFASYVPRNSFSAWHDPSYDVIGQMLGGSGSRNFQGDVKTMGGKLWKKWWHSIDKQKRYSRKTAGGLALTPPPPLWRRGLMIVRPAPHGCVFHASRRVPSRCVHAYTWTHRDGSQRNALKTHPCGAGVRVCGRTSLLVEPLQVAIRTNVTWTWQPDMTPL